jgi:hypothetical protein
MATVVAYTNCQKYVPIDLANASKVIASKAKQHVIASKAKQHVIASKAKQHVIASKAKQHVIASKAKQSNPKHHDPLRRIRLLRRRLAMTDYRNIFLTTAIKAFWIEIIILSSLMPINRYWL